MTEDTTSEVRLQLDAEPASAGEARRFVVATMQAWGCPGLADRGSLVVGELVTNAILHGLGPIDIVLRLHGDRMSIEVHDREPRLPVPTTRPPDADLSFGRGLHLVEATSVDWGSRPTPTGKVVWADIEARP